MLLRELLIDEGDILLGLLLEAIQNGKSAIHFRPIGERQRPALQVANYIAQQVTGKEGSRYFQSLVASSQGERRRYSPWDESRHLLVLARLEEDKYLVQNPPVVISDEGQAEFRGLGADVGVDLLVFLIKRIVLAQEVVVDLDLSSLSCE